MASSLNRVAYLDGIRAVAVLSVVLLHWLPQYIPDGLPKFEGGYIGVDLFLILSGYLISRILWRSPNEPMMNAYVKFIRNRARRLYPALLGMLLVITPMTFLLWPFADAVKSAFRALIAAAQLTPVISSLRLGSMTPFEHTWTLGWEWGFYLVWPLVLFFMRKRGICVFNVARFSAAAAAVLYAISVLTMSPLLMYYGPLGRFSQLLLGSALGLYFIARPEPLRMPLWARNTLMAGSIVGIWIWTVFGPTEQSRLYGIFGFPLVVVCGLVLVALGYGRENDLIPKMLAWTPAKSVGLWSYSIYLWHLPFLRLAQGPNFVVPDAVPAALALAGTVVFVWLSYRFLERPFQKAGGTQARRDRVVIQETTRAL